MFMEERQRKIVEMIQAEGSVSMAALAQQFGVSGESIRRDLLLLERKGLCKRTYGGAVVLQQVAIRPPVDRNFDEMPIYANYDRIAQEAVTMISPGDTVYLTGGSFGFLMLRHLPREMKCTLVVNSVDIANRLRAFTNVEVYVAGGHMRPSGSVVDSLACEFMSRLHFDVAFLTGSGLTAGFGLSNGTDETASLQRQVIKNARRRVLLMPSSKVGVDAFVKVCEAACFNTIITDWDCPTDELLHLEETGATVRIVQENP